MNIQFNTDVNTGSFRYEAGMVYDMDLTTANRFIAQGVASVVAVDPGVSTITAAQVAASTSWARFAPTMVVLGDSTASMCAAVTVGATRINLGNNWATLGLAIARNPMDLLGAPGHSGFRSDQIYPLYASDMASYASVGHVVLAMGTNDLIQGLGASYALYGTTSVPDAGLVNMITRVLADGKLPWLMTVSCGETFSGGSAAILQAWRDYNDGVRALADRFAVPLIDVQNAYVNPASAVSAPLAGYTDGSVHPANKGAIKWGEKFAETLGRISYKRALVNLVTGTGNVSSNPTLTGTGGTKPTGVTGSAPDGCNFTVDPAIPRCVSSVIRRADGRPGNWWQVSFDGVGANYLNLIVGAAKTIGTDFNIGDTVRLTGDLEIDAGHYGHYGIDLRLRFVGATTPQWVQAYSPASASGGLLDGARSWQWRIPEDVVIPSGTTSLAIYVFVINTAPFGGTIRVGAITGSKVT